MNSGYMRQACHWEDYISEVTGGDRWQVSFGVQVGVTRKKHKVGCHRYRYLMWVRASGEEITLVGVLSEIDSTHHEEGYQGTKFVIVHLGKD